MRSISVYGLLDEGTERFFYVGFTESTSDRIKAHRTRFKARKFRLVVLCVEHKKATALLKEALFIRHMVARGHVLENRNKVDKTPAAERGTFRAVCGSFPVSEIIRLIGCSQRTAYQWQAGRSLPPAWLQPLIVDCLRTKTPAGK